MLSLMSGVTHCREDEGGPSLKPTSGGWSLALTLVALRFA